MNPQIQNSQKETVVVPAPQAQHAAAATLRQRGRRFALLALILALGFASPLFGLARFALHSDLYSHGVLIPFISLYFVWMRRGVWPQDSPPAPRLAVLPLLAGFGLLVAYWIGVRAGWKPPLQDSLALMVLSFLLLLSGGALALLGAGVVRALAFPIAFLLFMVPFPEVLEEGIGKLLQHGSAEVSHALFQLSGMPVFRQGTAFQLPGFSLEVAPECSGIHSTLVLFITSVLAGHLFLRTPWKRTVLALAVIPLALLRNGLRIVTIGQLCVHISPDMIDSVIHRRGGPIFFALSLIPFFLLLFLLRRSDLKNHPLNPAPLSQPPKPKGLA